MLDKVETTSPSSSRIGWKATSGSLSSVELIKEFQSALSQEIDELKIGQKRQFELYDGERTGTLGGRYIYRFNAGDLSAWRRRRRGTKITISVAEKTIQGIIDIWNRKEAKLVLETDIGATIEKAVIEDSAIELLVNLNTKLEKVKTGSTDFNIEGGMKLFGFIQPQLFPAPIPLTHKNDDFCPNIEQERAIRASLSQEVTFIWGPPGTGKTKTLTSILKNLIQAHKRVLLVAHTNRAVDEILRKFVEDSNNLSLIEQGKIVRLGLPDDDDETLNCILLEKVAEKTAVRIKEKISALANQIESIQVTIKRYKNAEQTHHERIAEKEKNLVERRRIEQEISSLQKRSAIVNSDFIKNSDILLEKRQLLEKARTASAFKRLFSSLNKQQLEAEILSIENRKELLRLELESLTNQVSEKNREITLTTERIAQCDIRFDPTIEGIATIESLCNKIKSLQEEAESKNQLLIQLQTELSRVNDSIFNNAFVIGSTIARASLDTKIANRKFDTLIIDEASMAPLPNVFFLATVCSSHYIISGDFRQLPPIAQSKSGLSEKWLRTDIFKQAGIVDVVNTGILDDSRLVMLREQFRMHPAISNLVSNAVYEHRLRTPETVSKQKQNLAGMSPFKGLAVIFCDTATVNPLITVPEKTFSRLSPYSAAFCSRLAVECIEEAKKNGVKINVGIITPYREQAKLLSKMLEDKGIVPERCIASTVHRFQGAEKEVIIFDLVEGIPLRPGKLVSGTFKNSDAGKLITVAVSRAMGKFILVGNSEYIKEEFPSTDAVHQLLDKIKESGYCTDSREVELSFANETTIGSMGIFDASFDLLDTTDFYQVFKKDLNNAKSRIVIFSPFVSKRRVENLLPEFKHALKRGVEIFVIVRNPDLFKAYRNENIGTLNELATIGVKVILAYKGLGLDENIERFHYKVAVIDNIALYYGSLNILSQTDSAESMMVFRSKKAITQLSRVFHVSEITKGQKFAVICKSAETQEQCWQYKAASPFLNTEKFTIDQTVPPNHKSNVVIEKFGSVKPGKYVREYAEQKLCQIGTELGFTAVTNYPIENLFGDGRKRIISVVWLSAHNDIQVAFQVRRKAYDVNVITSLKDRRKLADLKAKEKYIVNVSEKDGSAHFFGVTAANIEYYSMQTKVIGNDDSLIRETQTPLYSISMAKQMTHANQRWTPEEETELKEAFTQGLTIRQLAKKHQRTRGAIQARLAQLGLIDNFYPFFVRKKKQSS